MNILGSADDCLKQITAFIVSFTLLLFYFSVRVITSKLAVLFHYVVSDLTIYSKCMRQDGQEKWGSVAFDPVAQCDPYGGARAGGWALVIVSMHAQYVGLFSCDYMGVFSFEVSTSASQFIA